MADMHEAVQEASQETQSPLRTQWRLLRKIGASAVRRVLGLEGRTPISSFDLNDAIQQDLDGAARTSLEPPVVTAERAARPITDAEGAWKQVASLYDGLPQSPDSAELLGTQIANAEHDLPIPITDGVIGKQPS